MRLLSLTTIILIAELFDGRAHASNIEHRASRLRARGVGDKLGKAPSALTGGRSGSPADLRKAPSTELNLGKLNLNPSQSPPTGSPHSTSPQRNLGSSRKPQPIASQSESPQPASPGKEATGRITRSMAKGPGSKGLSRERIRGGVKKPSGNRRKGSTSSGDERSSRSSSPAGSSDYEASDGEGGDATGSRPGLRPATTRGSPRDRSGEDNTGKTFQGMANTYPPSAARIAGEAYHGVAPGLAKVSSVTTNPASVATFNSFNAPFRGAWTAQSPAPPSHHASSPISAGIQHTTNGPGSISVDALHSVAYKLQTNPDSEGGKISWHFHDYDKSEEHVPPGATVSNILDNNSRSKRPFKLDITHTGGTAKVMASQKPRKDLNAKVDWVR